MTVNGSLSSSLTVIGRITPYTGMILTIIGGREYVVRRIGHLIVNDTDLVALNGSTVNCDGCVIMGNILLAKTVSIAEEEMPG
jgi:hypothetical protein